MSHFIQTNLCLISPLGEYLVSEIDSGKIILLRAATTKITLPTMKNGLSYKFLLGEDSNADIPIYIPGEGGSSFVGSFIITNTLDNDKMGYIPVANDEFISFTPAALTGDYIELTSDGRQWFVSGLSGSIGIEGTPPPPP